MNWHSFAKRLSPGQGSLVDKDVITMILTEIRELGVGYYAFSGKQAERDEQMRRLDEYRRETEKRKQENETKKQKQQVNMYFMIFYF